MKLKKVAALCKTAGVYNLCNQVDGDGTVGVQWLGDGEALYPMHGMPYLRESFVEKLEELAGAARWEFEKERGKGTLCAGDDGQEDLLEGTGDEEA